MAEAGGDMNHMNNMGGVQPDGMVHPFGLIPAGNEGMANDQNQLSRSSSMNRMEDSDPAGATPLPLQALAATSWAVPAA